MVALGDRLADRYELHDVIGRGGTATVYRAVDALLDRPVAVKVLTHPDPTRVRELRREARLLAAIQHPNVVAVHDVIERDDVTFLVLELVPGTDLATTLNREGPLAPEVVAGIVSDVAAALDSAHDRGVLHRDVKPANVLIDEHGRARVTDFGIGRFSTDDGTTGVHVRGSVAYVAPERLVGRSGGRGIDIYALAAVALEALTGQPPFPANAPTVAARSHLEEAPPRASQRRPELPAAVDHVILRGLAKNPDDRPDTAGEFADQFERALHRRRLPLAVLAALGGVAAIGVGFALAGTTDAPPPPAPTPTPGTAVGEPTAGAGPVPGLPEAVSPTTSPSPDASSSPEPLATPSPTEPSEQPPSDVDEAAARFRADLEAGRRDGRVSRRAVDDLEQKLADVLSAVDRGQRRRIEQRLRDLRERLDHWAERNELEVELANELDRRSRDLENLALQDG